MLCGGFGIPAQECPFHGEGGFGELAVVALEELGEELGVFGGERAVGGGHALQEVGQLGAVGEAAGGGDVAEGGVVAHLVEDVEGVDVAGVGAALLAEQAADLGRVEMAVGEDGEIHAAAGVGAEFGKEGGKVAVEPAAGGNDDVAHGHVVPAVFFAQVDGGDVGKAGGLGVAFQTTEHAAAVVEAVEALYFGGEAQGEGAGAAADIEQGVAGAEVHLGDKGIGVGAGLEDFGAEARGFAVPFGGGLFAEAEFGHALAVGCGKVGGQGAGMGHGAT